MLIEIIKPKIFEGHDLIVGYTTKSLEFAKNLPNGLDFKITHPKEFEQSHEIFALELRFPKENIIFNNQTHSNTVRIVDHESEQNIEFDGSATKDANLIICSKSADCSVVLFYDYQNKVIGCVHSGLAGTVNEINKSCIQKMQEIGADPTTTLAYICPTISQKNYPTTKTKAEEIPHQFKKSEKTVDGKNLLARLKYELPDRSEEVYFVDIKSTIKQQLLELGLKEENIEMSNLCTYDNSNLHSYRRECPNNGLGIGFIGMI
jgi:polyphenol oxidase